jgi:hypothetical protein
MASRTLPSPKVAPNTRCHCCRGPVPAPDPRTLEFEFETVHGKPCCSIDCKMTVNDHLLSDPPGVRLELVNAE